MWVQKMGAMVQKILVHTESVQIQLWPKVVQE